MLRRSVHSAPKPSQASLPVREAERAASATTTTTTTAPQQTSSPTDRPPRFYRTVDNISRGDSPSPTRSGSPTGSVEHRPHHRRHDDHQELEQAPTLESTRRGALHTLSLCRNVITILELTRLRKSRTGQLYWLSFWERIYEKPFSRMLTSRVTTALNKVDTLFRTVARDLHQLTQRIELALRQATSEKEMLRLLEQMEDEVGVWRRRRRKRAQAILNKMRVSIEAIPVKVSDELFDDMKSGVFALDVFCDYHPGDSKTENEVMWSEYMMQQAEDPVGSGCDEVST